MQLRLYLEIEIYTLFLLHLIQKYIQSYLKFGEKLSI